MTEHKYASPTVHMAVANVHTGRIGDTYTPTHDLSVMCRMAWKKRPRRTLRPDLVTCKACRALLAPSAAEEKKT